MQLEYLRCSTAINISTVAAFQIDRQRALFESLPLPAVSPLVPWSAVILVSLSTVAPIARVHPWPFPPADNLRAFPL